MPTWPPLTHQDVVDRVGAFQPYRSGWHAWPVGLQGASGLTGSGVLLLGLIHTGAGGQTVNGLTLNVTVAGSAGALLRLCAYDAVRYWPTNLLADAGTVDATTTGTKTASCSFVTPPGWMWVGASCHGAPATQPTVSSQGNAQSSSMWPQSNATAFDPIYPSTSGQNRLYTTWGAGGGPFAATIPPLEIGGTSGSILVAPRFA